MISAEREQEIRLDLKARAYGDDAEYWRETSGELQTALDASRAQAEALAEFCEWLARMDDLEDVLAREERRSVNLTQIIERARDKLAAYRKGLAG